MTLCQHRKAHIRPSSHPAPSLHVKLPITDHQIGDGCISAERDRRAKNSSRCSVECMRSAFTPYWTDN